MLASFPLVLAFESDGLTSSLPEPLMSTRLELESKRSPNDLCPPLSYFLYFPRDRVHCLFFTFTPVFICTVNSTCITAASQDKDW